MTNLSALVSIATLSVSEAQQDNEHNKVQCFSIDALPVGYEDACQQLKDIDFLRVDFDDGVVEVNQESPIFTIAQRVLSKRTKLAIIEANAIVVGTMVDTLTQRLEQYEEVGSELLYTVTVSHLSDMKESKNQYLGKAIIQEEDLIDYEYTLADEIEKALGVAS